MRPLVLIGGTPRCGSSALLKIINRHDAVGLFPEYDLPNVIRSMAALAQKEVFFSSKSWIKNVDSRSGSKQSIVDFRYAIPTKSTHMDSVSYLFATAFKKPTIEIIGEKYPRHWILDIKALATEFQFDLRLITLHRAPSAIQNSYEHRSELTRNGLDQWSYTNPSDSTKHWILSWVYNEIESICEVAKVYDFKYEELGDAEAQARFSEALGVNLDFSSDFSPSRVRHPLNVKSGGYLLTEVERAWGQQDLTELKRHFNQAYFKRRFWVWVLLKPFDSLCVKIGLLPVIFLPNLVYSVQRLRHRYRFHSWMLRRVFRVFSTR